MEVSGQLHPRYPLDRRLGGLQSRSGHSGEDKNFVDGKIILDWILGKQSGNVWNGCIWLRIGTSGLAHANMLMNFRVPKKM
jgi:hypothetical protein